MASKNIRISVLFFSVLAQQNTMCLHLMQPKQASSAPNAAVGPAATPPPAKDSQAATTKARAQDSDSDDDDNTEYFDCQGE